MTLNPNGLISTFRPLFIAPLIPEVGGVLVPEGLAAEVVGVVRWGAIAVGLVAVVVGLVMVVEGLCTLVGLVIVAV